MNGTEDMKMIKLNFQKNLINKYFKLKIKNKNIENSKDLLRAISKQFDEGLI